MTKELLQLQREIFALPIKDNLICFLVYGSIITDGNSANDFDGIIVVKKIDSSLNILFKILAKRYAVLDVNIYSHEEIVNGVSFYMREFKLEYLAEGICLYGENIFRHEFFKINKEQYKQSMLIRSIERMQMVRQKYFYANIPTEDKINYLKKYFLRISKSILILVGGESDDSLKKADQDIVNQKLVERGIFNNFPSTDKIKTVDDYFNLFGFIGKALVEYRKNTSSDKASFCKKHISSE